jgi:ABC-type sugar transport system ATPase subunit
MNGCPGVSAAVRRTDRPTAILARGLVKDFGTTRALDHLNMTIPAGEVHG